MQVLSKEKKFLVGIFIFLAAAGYGGYDLWRESVRRAAEIAELRGTVASLESGLTRLEGEKNALAEELLTERIMSGNFSSELELEKGKNRIFEAQISDISQVVGTLQKLSAIDPELLQKYSRVYFLSENYAPANLSAINQQYLYDKNRPQLIHSGVAGFLEGILASAARDGVPLFVVSAYRSFAEQAAVKTGHEVTYGSGANQFSADQGYSEHQLGTTVDFSAEGIAGLSLAFEDSAAYEWLEQNAYKFGFILSYPKGNTYYHFEPWHWRFVGVSLATRLRNRGEYFYSLTQREIDEYLISIFD